MSLSANVDQVRVMGLRELLAHPGRTIASVVVLTISSAFLVAMIGISGSVTGTVRQVADAVSGNAPLEVSGITDSGFDDDLADVVAGVPGVQVAAPMVRSQVGTKAGPALLIGADLSGTRLTSPLIEASQHHLAALVSSPGSVLVGPALTSPAGAAVEIGGRTLSVAATVTGSAAERVSQGAFILAPLPLAQRITGHTGRLDAILVAIEPSADLATVRDRLTQAVAGRAVVGDSVERVAQTGNGIRILQYLTLMSAGVAFVVAAFLIYTVMSIAINQRRPALSMLRAIGGRRRTLITNLLGEAAALGLLGGVLGAGAGMVIGGVAVSNLPPTLVQSTNLRLEYLLPWYAAPAAVIVAVAMTVAAAVAAAYQVYKVSPLEALAPVEISLESGLPGWLRTLAAVAWAVLLAAAVAVNVLGSDNLVLSAMGIALFFGSGLMLCVAASTHLVSLTAALARRLTGAGRLAAATIERSATRVWTTLMTVVIAVAMTVTITGANQDTITAAKSSLAPYAQTSIFVSSNPPTELPTGAALPESLSTQIATMSAVDRVVPGRVAFATVNGTRVALNGLSSGTSSPVFELVSADLRSALLAGEGVVISKSLGRSLNVSAGDMIDLQTPSGPRQVKVLQLIPYLSVVDGVIGLSQDSMGTWFGLPGSTLLEVYTQPDVDPDGVLAQVRSLLPPGVHAFTGADALSGSESALHQVTAIANAMWVIVVLIAGIALLNTVTMSVLARLRELGVLRAIGADRRTILHMVLVEAASVGIVGAIVGLIFGLICQYFYDAATPAVLNFDVAYRPDLGALGFAALALVLCLLGCISPAVRAARVDILRALSTD